MKSIKRTFVLVASVLLVIMASSCASSAFSEKSSIMNNEMTTFQNVNLDSTIKLEELKRLGQITAQRTITYTLQPNGDYVMEMGDFKYSYTALSTKVDIEGVRVIGNLKSASVAGPAAIGGGSMDLFSMLLPSGPAAAPEAPSVATIGPKSVALDAVNFDLMKAAAAKGGVALLMPEYSWEIEEDQTGTKTDGFLILPPTKTYSTKVLKYTVTARATAVAF